MDSVRNWHMTIQHVDLSSRVINSSHFRLLASRPNCAYDVGGDGSGQRWRPQNAADVQICQRWPFMYLTSSPWAVMPSWQ